MKQFLRPALAAVFVWPLAAHDLEAKVELTSRAVILSAYYAGGGSAPFIQVSVFSPASGGKEFQSGRTDANGAFAFVADRPGEWRCILDDELGHRKELAIEVTPEGRGAKTSAPAATGIPVERMLTGVSLLAGLSGLLLWHKARRVQGTPR